MGDNYEIRASSVRCVRRDINVIYRIFGRIEITDFDVFRYPEHDDGILSIVKYMDKHIMPIYYRNPPSLEIFNASPLLRVLLLCFSEVSSHTIIEMMNTHIEETPPAENVLYHPLLAQLNSFDLSRCIDMCTYHRVINYMFTLYAKIRNYNFFQCSQYLNNDMLSATYQYIFFDMIPTAKIKRRLFSPSRLTVDFNRIPDTLISILYHKPVKLPLYTIKKLIRRIVAMNDENRLRLAHMFMECNYDTMHNGITSTFYGYPGLGLAIVDSILRSNHETEHILTMINGTEIVSYIPYFKRKDLYETYSIPLKKSHCHIKTDIIYSHNHIHDDAYMYR